MSKLGFILKPFGRIWRPNNGVKLAFQKLP